jgi:hypothetical protein
MDRPNTFQDLTPGEIGILAVALDDALAAGYGDDDICHELALALEANLIAHSIRARQIAYGFYRNATGRI